MRVPVSPATASASASITALQISSSRPVAASGIMISGTGAASPFAAMAVAASKMARACMRQISG